MPSVTLVFAQVATTASHPLFPGMNFSGQAIIVIGVGRLFRQALPKKIDRPSEAPNFMVFWNRCDISMTAFFKDYVFNPLVLALMRRFEDSRVEPFLAVAAFLFTFTLLGIWHGQTSLVLIDGIVLGCGVGADKLCQLLPAKRIG